jgi:hypothetical protein
MRQTHGGFEERFIVQRTDGKPCRDEARYVVLDYATDPHAKVALKAYADSIEAENPILAHDFRGAIFLPQDFPKQHTPAFFNVYTLLFTTVCPVNSLPVQYELEVTSVHRIMAEDLQAACAELKTGLHEDIADKLYERFGGRQSLKAFHHGVDIFTRRG